jgi:Lrp/AsnC family transcriptional regulator for asnA, asnC and gidA
MEELGLIMGSSLILDYEKLGCSFVVYIGILLNKTNQINLVIERLVEIPNVTNVHISTGKFNLYCKIRTKNTSDAKNIIFQIDDIKGVDRTETMISLEESFNDKNRLMHQIFNEL